MSTSSSKSTKVLTTVVIVAALVGAGLLIARQKSKPGTEKPPEPAPVMVEALALKTAKVMLTLPLLADVQAVREVNIASRLTGYVTELRHLEGDRVKKGDVLVRLDDADARSQVQRAEADLARTQLQQGTLSADLAAAQIAAQALSDRAARAKALYDFKGVSLEQLQSEQSNLAASEARLAGTQAAVQAYHAGLLSAQAATRAARENLAYAVITAPFDGIVAARPMQVGDLATPGKPLLRLVAIGEQRLLVSLPDTTRAVGLRWQDKVLPLKPWPEANAQGLRRYEARAMNLAPGTRLNVELLTFDDDAVLLPDACLLNNNGRSATVFLLRDNGSAKPLSVALAASGTQGAASTDARLNGISVACGGADVLTRLALGVPFKTAKGN